MIMDAPLFKELVPVARPFMPPLQDYCAALERVWDRAYLSNGGPELVDFRERLSDLCQTDNTLLFSNGSLALEAALEMFDLRGDVILPSFTFPSTANAVVRAGLKPVFADIEPERLTIDPDHVARLCSGTTAAILGVHMFGMPCFVEELAAIAAQHKIPLIFDGAHAFAVTYKGHPISDYGDASMFSLHATKALHSAEGGLLVFKDAERGPWLADFINHGLAGVAGRATNAKMSEPIALLGRLVLEHLPVVRQSLLALRECYDRELAGLPGIKPIYHAIPDLEGASGFYPILLEPEIIGMSRDAFMDCLRIQNVATRAYFSPPLHTDPRFGASHVDARVTTDFSSRIVALPFFADLGLENAQAIASLVRRTIGSDRRAGMKSGSQG